MRFYRFIWSWKTPLHFEGLQGMKVEEGVIKFACDWKQAEAPDQEYVEILEHWRKQLYAFKLIGAYSDGIGYGNISMKSGDDQFIITGSQTGHIECLTNEHYTRVVDWDLQHNSLVCNGPIKASSESLTHASLYDASDQIEAVIHVHHKEMWEKLINNVPTSSVDAVYGTPEMANEVKRLFLQSELPHKKIMVMGGHEEGIISFGRDLDEAGAILLQYFQQL